MFKNLATGAILALVVCTVVAHGTEGNIQEVLEERYKQLAAGVPEVGTLSVVASKERVAEAATTEDQELPQEVTTNLCKCQHAAEVPTRVEPKPAKMAKKPKQDKTQTCDSESAAADATVEVIREHVSLAQPCPNPPPAAVAEKQEERQELQEQSVPEEEIIKEEPVEKKSTKKDNNKNKNKKRDKRDTKGGKNKSKANNKSKSKRSSESKSKGKDKKSKK